MMRRFTVHHFRPFFAPPLAMLACALTLAALGCGGSNNLPASEAVVAVETTPAAVRSIASIVSGEGVLFPIHQASISPKITAPVRKFYVQRGDRVHSDELLATLENHDLAAAVVSAQGSYDQARANYASATTSTLPEEIQTATL